MKDQNYKTAFFLYALILLHSYVDSIYPSILDIKDPTGSCMQTSYLDILLKRYINGKLTTQLYYKQCDFN